MKQNITADQLGELSEKGKLHLWSWSKTRGRFGMVASLNKFEYPLPLLSIGNMIEFLEDVSIHKWYGRWYVEPKNMNEIVKRELCDVLWSACKEVLEGKEC